MNAATDPVRAVPLDLPWLREPLAAMRRASEAKRLPPAILVHEAPGCGGLAFARQLAELALCRESPAPCGRCRDCLRVAANEHPDLHLLQVEEDRTQIRVEQVRELIAELQLTSHERGRRIAVIEPAERMNNSTASALLKTLEEPAADASIVLVTTVPSLLPATVRSRCLRVTIDAPPRAEAVAWLETQAPGKDWNAVLGILGVAPLTALDSDPKLLLDCHRETGEALRAAASGTLDIPQVAEQWSRQDWLPLRLRCVENWITAWLEQRLRGTAAGAELQTAAQLRGGVRELNIHSLVRLLGQARECSRQLALPLNKALALEQLFWLARPAER